MHAARSNLHTPRSASGLGATVRAVIGLALAPSAAHADIEVVPVSTVPASEITHRLILSGDGQVVFRSASPTPYAPSVVRRWTQASGHVVVPPPEGRTAWVARSTSMFGEWTAGEATMGMTSHACMHHAPSGSYVPIFHDYRSAAIGVTPLQVHAAENQNCWYWLPGDGFFSVGSIPVGQISAVHDVAGTHLAGVGAGVSIHRTGSRTLPWVSVASGIALLGIPSPFTDAEAIDISDDMRRVTGVCRMLHASGAWRMGLARWVDSPTPTLHEPVGGAETLEVLGATFSGKTVVVRMNDFALGTPRPESIWDEVHGFLTANQYLALKGYGAGPSVERIVEISDTGATVLAMLPGQQLVLIRGLEYASCGESISESCFVEHVTPNCNDGACCTAVCALDDYCCDTAWDQLCAGMARSLCAGCGDPSNGTCIEPHAGVGCSDAACCESVCGNDPFCCDTNWDWLCSDGALVLCRTGHTCAEAQLLTANFPESLRISTSGVAPDGVVTPCGVSDTIATWRILRAACSGISKLTVCNTSDLTTQGVITVYDRCGGTVLACSADSPACTAPFSVGVELFTVAGQEYLVRFSAESNGLHLFPGAQLSVECTAVCGTGGSCTTPHGPGCSDASCCELVCASDPYCCGVEWDSVCVNGAMAGCFDPADLNHDGVIDAADLAMVLAAWGLGGPTDLTGDGTTDASDLAMVLAAWS